jgi:hypothetical protein
MTRQRTRILRSGEFYEGIGGPLYAVHPNGHVYAIFSGPNQALAYWRGLDARGRSIFHIENVEGERVALADNPRAPGHATAILDTLKRKDAEQ